MKFIIGKKIEMTQIWQDGKVVPCTLIEAGPCVITQIKNKESDGYSAVQFGYETKVKNVKKTEKGKEFKCLREARISESETKDYELGKRIDLSVFEEGEIVKVSGVSKGKGFQGAVKKWGFKGRNQTHGVKHEHRTLGSVGSSGPGRVFPGRKMPGRMGGERTTVKSLKIAKVDIENNIIAIKGAIPGHRGTVVEIRK